MKKIFINDRAYTEMKALAAAGLPATRPIGYAYDQLGHQIRLFLGTDQETGAPATDVNGNLAVNLRASRPKAQ